MLIIGIFLFICSLEGVKSGFKLIFSEWQAGILGMIDANTAPVTGLAIGILGTALVQSSSAVVAATMVSMSSMVSGGLSMESAMRFGVPMVLGANIGTTITNTIVVFGIKRGMTMKELGETIPGVIVRARKLYFRLLPCCRIYVQETFFFPYSFLHFILSLVMSSESESGTSRQK